MRNPEPPHSAYPRYNLGSTLHNFIRVLVLTGLVSGAAFAQSSPTISAVRPSKLKLGEVSLTVAGSGFQSGAQIWFGNASGGAFLTTTYRSTKRLTASVLVTEDLGPVALIYVRNPDGAESNIVEVPVDSSSGGGGGKGGPSLSRAGAMRFLAQATWGPTEDTIAQIIEGGKEAFLEAQFAAVPSTYPDPIEGVTDFRPAQEKFFYNAVHGGDQLRQRMAFFLSQIWVVSANTVGRSEQMVPYLRLLHGQAFGSYLDIMRQVTLSPTMGRYLDMVNNAKTEPGSGVNPNENYPREVLQLFTVGPTKLNLNGSPQTDPAGDTIPTYDEDVILNLARVFTGWPYPTKPDATPHWHNPSYYAGPMESFDAYHDTSQKTLLDGYLIPIGGTAQADLDMALDHIFEHPNVGPFLAVRMIRHFVTSNPSSQYVRRISKVFNNNGQGVRGDLRAVIKAVLLDREASSTAADQGHLREPILFANALLRALGATLLEQNPMRSRTRSMGQEVFRPPTVFNYFHLAHGTFHGDESGPGDGPEFQIHTLATAIDRADFIYRVVRNILGDAAVLDLSPYLALTDDPAALTDLAIYNLLPDPLSATERQSIIDAVSNVSSGNPNRRVEYALYLVAVTRLQVQR